MLNILTVILIQILLKVHSELYEGDNCTLSTNIKGKCINIHDCPRAKHQLKQNIKPHTCSFMGKDPIVCCVLSKSEEICKKYGEELRTLNVYSIVGGDDAITGQFPHMAAIGFGNKDNIHWKCGGSLISDKYVLTAAHCLRDESGDAKFVQMGDNNLIGESSTRQHFEIIRKIPHPDYKQPFVYNDIALLELDKKPKFSWKLKPACLHQDMETSELDDMSVSGWGLTKNAGNPSNSLQTVTLSLFNTEECNKSYKASRRRLPKGILEDKMVCAGGREKEADSCQGDSGGPLQTYRSRELLYSIVGVTSFGKACGTVNVAGVYTKVAHYIPWIESVVWP